MAVIIASHNAASTVALSITTALREPEVSEVVVVDDASTDATLTEAARADDGTGRLSILRLDRNMGPAFARNLAIERSTAPLISVLDADDFFIAGRFAKILAEREWDIIADNIIFLGPNPSGPGRPIVPPVFQTDAEYLDFARFVDGNVSAPHTNRRELGFLKPVMRRAFLKQHGLGYNDKLRLGEDYELYARALASGARFKIIKSCGYCAVVRPDSLSGGHGSTDLRLLADADLALIAMQDLAPASRAALERHERHVRDKYRLAHFLELKWARGIAAAVSYGLAERGNPVPIAKGVLRDKSHQLRRWLDRGRRRETAATPYLLPANLLGEVTGRNS